MAVSRAASGFGELLGLDGVGDSLSGVLNEYQPDDVAHHDRLVSVPLTGRNEDAVSGGEADSHAIEIDVQVASEDVADMAALTPVVRPPSLEGTGSPSSGDAAVSSPEVGRANCARWRDIEFGQPGLDSGCGLRREPVLQLGQQMTLVFGAGLKLALVANNRPRHAGQWSAQTVGVSQLAGVQGEGDCAAVAPNLDVTNGHALPPALDAAGQSRPSCRSNALRLSCEHCRSLLAQP